MAIRDKIFPLAIGSVGSIAVISGIAFAAGAQTPTPTAPAAQTQQDDAGEQEPMLNSSIMTAPEDESATELSDAEETAALEALATVSQADAEAAALTAVPGTVDGSELENDNGAVVWEVEVTAADGTRHEVAVDAGNAAVLAQEADDEGDDHDGQDNESSDDDGDEGPETGEANEGPEAGDATGQ